MQCRWAVKLGEIRDEMLRFLEALLKRLEFDHLGLLDLRKDSTTLVIARKSRRVTNREAVRTLDSNLAWFAPVQLLQSLDLTERHVVSILQSVPSLIEGGDEAFCALVDRSDHSAEWLLTRRVDAGKLGPKVAKDATEETSGVCCDEEGVGAVGEVVDLELLGEWRIGQNHYLETRQDLFGELLLLQCTDRDVGVELGQAWRCRFGS